MNRTKRIDIEKNIYVPTYYVLYAQFHFTSNKSVFIFSRTNSTQRILSITISSNGQLIVKHNKTTDTFNVELCDINKLTATWVSLSSFIIDVNGITYDIGGVMADTDTFIEYDDCEIIDYGVKYLNFSSDIPRVYGTCFTNIHTHKMFGKYFYENGANYYVYNKPNLKDPNILFNQIRIDNTISKPKKVYIFQGASLKTFRNEDLVHLDRLYKVIDDFPDIEFVTVTFYRENHEIDRYNTLLRMSGIPYIDVEAMFMELDNQSDYFIDNAHTNEKGGYLISELMRQQAPDLVKHYELTKLKY